jgi:hypothetical protein
VTWITPPGPMGKPATSVMKPHQLSVPRIANPAIFDSNPIRGKRASRRRGSVHAGQSAWRKLRFPTRQEPTDVSPQFHEEAKVVSQNKVQIFPHRRRP